MNGKEVCFPACFLFEDRAGMSAGGRSGLQAGKAVFKNIRSYGSMDDRQPGSMKLGYPPRAKTRQKANNHQARHIKISWDYLFPLYPSKMGVKTVFFYRIRPKYTNECQIMPANA
ncbi:hypothetical protein ACM46_09975 [Chryseobacterium angstadtii]|uniref:Uncharacterized protein n=1 Tax=Chryseobacterium angstadtii TaxID=558151 RepID=A0A0J7IF90_9FLAO|nr:hypothetical protein ACM46_09975 [Chryseobacterium angstadtii]